MAAVTKIYYRCIKKPVELNLEGFEVNKTYRGRSFNNLCEISVEWASHKPTYLIEKKVFDQYFEIIDTPELVKK
ncbi:MAG TPA: hypothetical protein VIK89_13295 [Cytophagaceae bacterium]